jgi:hypothetical protein
MGGYVLCACGFISAVTGETLYRFKKEEKYKRVVKYSAGIFVVGALFFFIIFILSVTGIVNA